MIHKMSPPTHPKRPCDTAPKDQWIGYAQELGRIIIAQCRKQKHDADRFAELEEKIVLAGMR
jgi:hypothetical protein